MLDPTSFVIGLLLAVVIVLVLCFLWMVKANHNMGLRVMQAEFSISMLKQNEIALYANAKKVEENAGRFYAFHATRLGYATGLPVAPKPDSPFATTDGQEKEKDRTDALVTPPENDLEDAGAFFDQMAARASKSDPDVADFLVTPIPTVEIEP